MSHIRGTDFLVLQKEKIDKDKNSNRMKMLRRDNSI